MNPEELRADPNPLAAHYEQFRVAERFLLDGHSHQAWPDVSFKGQVQSWNDAAAHLGEKWERAFHKAQAVRRGYSRLMDDAEGLYALASNTHDLLLRFLSALPWRQRQKLVTTDGEFHTIRRQLHRLQEEGVEVVRVASGGGEIAEGLRRAVDDRTAAVLVSSVFFRDGTIVEGLDTVLETCQSYGAELLIDTYHSLNVAPFSIRGQGLDGAFAVGGGYKYCQLGEGNCFLRIPPHRSFRPIFTGWFSEFSALESPSNSGAVVYGEGADVFAGSTYDPTSHYRAAEVLSFFERMGLDPATLRRVSQHQTELLGTEFDALDLPSELITRDRTLPRHRRAGFLALSTPWAGEFQAELRKRGVRTDHRDGYLRLGPAPYLSDRQLRDAIGLLGEAAQTLLAKA